MQTYEVTTMPDYAIALQDIILHHHIGVIKANIPGCSTGCFMHYTVSLPDITLIYSLQDSFSSPKECTMLPIETLLTRFTFNGIYANGIIYNPKYNLFPNPVFNTKPADTGSLKIVYTNKLLDELNKKVDDYIWNKIKILYPTHNLIPQPYWYDSDETIREIAMKYALSDKNIEEAKETPKNPKLESLRTLIQYHQAIVNQKENAFVKEKAESLFATEGIKKKYLCRLSMQYQIANEIKNFTKNENPEDTLYKKIRKLFDAFLQENPKIKNIRVILKGRNDLLDTYFKKHHPNFSIEGKDIELFLDAKRIYTYEYTRKFNSWNFIIVKPKVKQEYSNRNENYLVDFMPSDVKLISYGKKIIYQAET